jgi:hypothetical protein
VGEMTTSESDIVKILEMYIDACDGFVRDIKKERLFRAAEKRLILAYFDKWFQTEKVKGEMIKYG